jgi:hypothetical protein
MNRRRQKAAQGAYNLFVNYIINDKPNAGKSFPKPCYSHRYQLSFEVFTDSSDPEGIGLDDITEALYEVIRDINLEQEPHDVYDLFGDPITKEVI